MTFLIFLTKQINNKIKYKTNKFQLYLNKIRLIIHQINNLDGKMMILEILMTFFMVVNLQVTNKQQNKKKYLSNHQ